MIPVINKQKLEIVKILRSQNLYFLFFINLRMIVIPFHNKAIENIIKDPIKIKPVFFNIPKYETGWILGSNSGKRNKHIIGAIKPIRIEQERYIFLIFLTTFLFIYDVVKSH